MLNQSAMTVIDFQTLLTSQQKNSNRTLANDGSTTSDLKTGIIVASVTENNVGNLKLKYICGAVFQGFRL